MSDEVKNGTETVIAQAPSNERRKFLRRGGALTGAALMSLVPDAIRQAGRGPAPIVNGLVASAGDASPSAISRLTVNAP